MKLSQEDIQFRRNWFDDEVIKDFISRQAVFGHEHKLYFREMVFLDKHSKGEDRAMTCRLMLGHRKDMIQNSMKYYKFHDKGYCIYHTNMFFNHLPLGSWNYAENKRQREAWFGEAGGYKKEMFNYEFVLDLDGEADNLQPVIKDALALSRLFDLWNTPYFIKFSGSKGFHITIPLRYLLDKSLGWTAVTAPQISAHIATTLKENFGIGSIDTSIYDELRLMRTAYSIDTFNGRHNIVRPLTLKELECFSLDMVDARKHINRTIDFKYQGFKMRNKEGDVKELFARMR